MPFFKELWLGLNIILILLILLRSPFDQSVQEVLEPFDFFESSKNTKKNLDKTIGFFIFLYFLFGLIGNYKLF